jgi:hypothetical protein
MGGVYGRRKYCLERIVVYKVIIKSYLFFEQRRFILKSRALFDIKDILEGALNFYLFIKNRAIFR